jgi:hypothetical protein
LPIRPEYANFRDNFTAVCQENDFTPDFVLKEMDSFEALAMMDMKGKVQIALDSDVSFSASLFLVNEECRYLTFVEEYYATPYLIYSTDSPSPLIATFVECLIDLSRNEYHA